MYFTVLKELWVLNPVVIRPSNCNAERDYFRSRTERVTERIVHEMILLHGRIEIQIEWDEL